MDLQQTLYGSRSYNESDLQISIARKIGDRELAVFWSRETHRFTLEVGASSF
jgi:hypothetical protein